MKDSSRGSTSLDMALRSQQHLNANTIMQTSADLCRNRCKFIMILFGELEDQ